MTVQYTLAREGSQTVGTWPKQVPITRREQRPCGRVTAFSLTGSFLERFWREF